MPTAMLRHFPCLKRNTLSVQRDIADRAVTKHIPIVIVTGSTRPLDNLPVACVLRKPVDPEELVQWVAERVAPYERIRRVEVVEELPKSPTGKLLRRVLRERKPA